MSYLSDTDIDTLITCIDNSRTVTIDPGGPNEVADLPAKLDDASSRQDLATGEMIAVRAQLLVRRSAVEGKVVGGHQNGTQIRDNSHGIFYKALDVLKDDLYARIILTRV